MKFYVIQTKQGETIGCETSLKAAKAKAAEMGYNQDEVEVYSVNVAVTAESIRRILGNIGGYAKD